MEAEANNTTTCVAAAKFDAGFETMWGLSEAVWQKTGLPRPPTTVTTTTSTSAPRDDKQSPLLSSVKIEQVSNLEHKAGERKKTEEDDSDETGDTIAAMRSAVAAMRSDISSMRADLETLTKRRRIQEQEFGVYKWVAIAIALLFASLCIWCIPSLQSIQNEQIDLRSLVHMIHQSSSPTTAPPKDSTITPASAAPASQFSEKSDTPHNVHPTYPFEYEFDNDEFPYMYAAYSNAACSKFSIDYLFKDDFPSIKMSRSDLLFHGATDAKLQTYSSPDAISHASATFQSRITSIQRVINVLQRGDKIADETAVIALLDEIHVLQLSIKILQRFSIRVAAGSKSISFEAGTQHGHAWVARSVVFQLLHHHLGKYGISVALTSSGDKVFIDATFSK